MDKWNIYLLLCMFVCLLSVSVSGGKHRRRDHRLKYQLDVDDDDNDVRGKYKYNKYRDNKEEDVGIDIDKDNFDKKNKDIDSNDKVKAKGERAWKQMQGYDKTEHLLCESLKCRKHQLCLVNKQRGKARCVSKKRALRERRKYMHQQKDEDRHSVKSLYGDSNKDDDHHDLDDDDHDDHSGIHKGSNNNQDNQRHNYGDDDDNDHVKHHDDDDNDVDDDETKHHRAHIKHHKDDDDDDHMKHHDDDDNDVDDDDHYEEITLDDNDIMSSDKSHTYSHGHYMRMTDEDLHQRNKELKIQLREYNKRRKHHTDRKLKQIDAVRAEHANLVDGFESEAVAEVKKTVTKAPKTCSVKELTQMGTRLLDWFKIIQDDVRSDHKMKRSSIKKDLRPKDECICQGPVSNQFAILDGDLSNDLDLSELNDLEHTGYEHCVEPFLDLCDLDKDKILSNKEWCCCFADILPPCIEAQKYIPSTEANGKVYITPGMFVPECDEDGFFRRTQCHSSVGQCWCVDRNGVEIDGTRTRGMPECDPKEMLQLE